MKVECNIRLEDPLVPANCIKRFLNCVLCVGVMKPSDVKNPQLYVRIATRSFQYQITKNIRRVLGVKENSGKATIEFDMPRHFLMIKCEPEGLHKLLELLKRFSNPKCFSPSDVPILTDLKRPTGKSKVLNNSDRKSSDPSFAAQLKQHPSLWKAMDNLQKLVLNDITNISFPVVLGRVPLQEVRIKNLRLQDKDLLWLNELPLRNSLKTLELSQNKLTKFPTAVIDCLSLVTLILDHNAIEYIPHGLHRLKKLRFLQMAYNHLHYLPADITSLRLESIDIADNHLHCNIIVPFDASDCNLRGSLRLQDWAALNVDPTSRFHWTAEDCPSNLLQDLRSLSRCICGKIAIRDARTAYYVPLGTVRFSASSWTAPQHRAADQCSLKIYVQYHFCTYLSHCVHRKFTRDNCFRLREVHFLNKVRTCDH